MLCKKQIKIMSVFLVVISFFVVDLWADNSQLVEQLKSIDSRFIGKRLLIGWRGHRTFAREELVVKRSGEEPLIKLLTPAMEEKKRRRLQLNRRKKGRPPLLLHMHNPIELITKNLEITVKNYQFESADIIEKIAGHETELIEIKPKFHHISTYRVWIEKKHGVILRLEKSDRRGHNKFISVFTQIDFDSPQIDEKASELSEGNGIIDRGKKGIKLTLEEAQKLSENMLILPSYLPKGFELVSIDRPPMAGSSKIHLRYSDGLEMFSLFEGKNSKKDRPLISELRGKTRVEYVNGLKVRIANRGGVRVIYWLRDKQHFALIGGLDELEMLKIVESTR